MIENKILWGCMLAAASALFYTLTFANGKYILTGNGEQVAFTEVSECTQYLHKKQNAGKSAHYRERNAVARSLRRHIWANAAMRGEVF